jgi:zinc finger CCHC domain-containing protein 9
MVLKAKHPKIKSDKQKKKITKDERRAKYTQIAHDRRDKKLKRERNRNITCFKCRQPGHTAIECSGGGNKECCYKCGEMTHSLKECNKFNPKIPLQEQDLPYATCFVCKNIGHLASQCTMNEKGIYVNGGCCHKCGSHLHRSTACPTMMKEKAKIDDVVEENYDDLLGNAETKADKKCDLESATTKSRKKRDVVKF